MKKKVLTLDDILRAADVQEKELFIEEWGGSVKIKNLTKEAELKIRKKATDKDGNLDEATFEILLLVECLVEPKITEEDAKKLLERSASAVNKILMAIIELSGFRIDEKKARDFFR